MCLKHQKLCYYDCHALLTWKTTFPKQNREYYPCELQCVLKLAENIFYFYVK